MLNLKCKTLLINSLYFFYYAFILFSIKNRSACKSRTVFFIKIIFQSKSKKSSKNDFSSSPLSNQIPRHFGQ
jgi:hypothetical protein